ncbi:MAG: alanine--tRNA ligase [Deltaproteobacteria bacterium]|jgi:alanyl-tRNA synthetase|nr:alanine--tRNA ligase [Deltaproteobacteria bacterium]
MISSDLRRAFLEYFAKRDHRRVGSSSLVPRDDPTLLFTNAGMVQFKRLFTGEEKRDYHRAVTSQKCVRAGGKHNDLENVGYTARHHTFFEMLGNFSFGNYFKAEAIVFAYELLTTVFGLAADKLYATVFEDDDEAASLWPRLTDIPESRLVRLGEKDNFWAMGDTGPCGPCSEILYDQGPSLGCGKPDCGPGCDCDRYLEIWNLVFMQFSKAVDGSISPLPRPSIDTGMGLERLAAVVQNVPSNFETDLFQPLLAKVSHLSGVPYVYGANLTPNDPSFQTNVSLRVIADHSRAITFLISDGVRPENLGRGYVLRRVLRRAVRHGRKLGLTKPFLSEMCQEVIKTLKEPYPEIADQASYLTSLVRAEEERFGETLGAGLTILNEAINELKATGKTVLAGQVAFKLYDTYGFPLDLTGDVARENALTVDQTGFDAAMSDQKAKGRAAWKAGRPEADEANALVSELTRTGFTTDFLGYDTLTATAETPALLVCQGHEVTTASVGQAINLVFPRTPFYAASGGQIGDTGTIHFPAGEVAVQETIKAPGGVVIHRGQVLKGTINLEPATLEVDAAKRRATAANHTATHLLHLALRRTLGDHVRQAGSLVTDTRFRFDFTHQAQVTDEELSLIEAAVNQDIRQNFPVETTVLNYDEAVRSGAVALFEERYGDKVRVVNMGDSRELCGGTHAQRTGDLGVFLIVSESSVAAGVRRLECLTGGGAFAEVQGQRAKLKELGSLLKARPEELSSRVLRLLERIQELSKPGKPSAPVGLDPKALLKKAETLGDISYLAQEVNVAEPKDLRELADALKDQLGPKSLVALAAKSGDKALLLVAVSPDLAAKFPAGRLIGPMAEAVGGRGGGKPLLAQAGGPNAKDTPKALAAFRQTLLTLAKS